MKNLQKGSVIPLIIAIIALLCIGGGAYVYVNKKSVNTPVQETPKVVESTSTPVVKVESKVVATTTTKSTTQAPIIKNAESLDVQANNTKSTVYKNTKIGIEFSYPSDYKISEIGGGITTTVAIDRGPKTNLYFLFQARADDISSYKVLSTKKIMIRNIEAIERIYSIDGSSEITLQIEVKRYMFEGFERADSFGSNFKNIDDANNGAKEIEDIAKTLKYL